jgi:hypothetical protein
MADPIRDWSMSSHAIREMRRRGIDQAIVRQVLAAPEHRAAIRSGRDVLQARIAFERKTYLVRVFVDVDRTPPEVVTVYRTSKIAKYWRDER